MKKIQAVFIILVLLCLVGCNAMNADMPPVGAGNDSGTQSTAPSEDPIDYSQDTDISFEPDYSQDTDISFEPDYSAGGDVSEEVSEGPKPLVEAGDLEYMYITKDAMQTKVLQFEMDINILCDDGSWLKHNPEGAYEIEFLDCFINETSNENFSLTFAATPDSITVFCHDGEEWAAGIIENGTPVEISEDGMITLLDGTNIYIVTVEWAETNTYCNGTAKYAFAINR